MMLTVLLVSLLSIAVAQTDNCSVYGGICSYNQCSRYFVSPTQFQLCPNPFQRCCLPELCLTRLKGNCQSSLQTCRGARYTHFGTSSLCQRTGDICCVSSFPSATTPLPSNPTVPVKKDECLDLGGKCQNQVTSCVGGSYKLLGSNSEILCNNWYQGNERCCIPNAVVPRTTTTSPVQPKPTTSKESCGVQKVTLFNKRIIGGKAAEKGEWPWQVSIVKSSSYFGRRLRHSCGGTLIAPQWVVSAAHCFTDVTSHYSIKVRVGEHSFLVDEGTETDNQVIDIVRYPTYSKSNNKNDIALIKLAQPVDLSSPYIGMACLARSADMSNFYSTSDCYSTGWGYTRGTSGDRNVLQEVQSTLVDQRTCLSKWGYKIDSTKVCFGNGYKGACMGDSGGPLVCKKNGLFYLVGVVSYGSESCTDKYVPTVYTSVAAYNQWINTVISTR